MTHLVYLACPYSDPSPEVREQRFQAVNKAASKLMREGIKVFSPISHSHPIALAGGLPTGWLFWAEYDRAVMECCNKVIVLMLPGWDTSREVFCEVMLAGSMQLPVEYLEPEK